MPTALSALLVLEGCWELWKPPNELLNTQGDASSSSLASKLSLVSSIPQAPPGRSFAGRIMDGSMRSEGSFTVRCQRPVVQTDKSTNNHDLHARSCSKTRAAEQGHIFTSSTIMPWRGGGWEMGTQERAPDQQWGNSMVASWK